MGCGQSLNAIDVKEDIKEQRKKSNQELGKNLLNKNLKEEDKESTNKIKEPLIKDENSHPITNKKKLEPSTEEKKKEKEREIRKDNGVRKKKEKEENKIKKELEESERRKKIKEYVNEKRKEFEEYERRKNKIIKFESAKKEEDKEKEKIKRKIELLERKEIEKEKEKKNKMINLYLLLKNLEAVKKDIEKLRENIHQIFDSYRDNSNEGQDINKIKEEIIDKVLGKIIEYLDLDDNNDSKGIIKKILKDSYKEKGNIDQFKDYLDVILNSVNNFYNIDKSNKDRMINYIINYFNSKEGLIEVLMSRYQNVDFIEYEDFTKLIKENNIAIEETAMEYLIFRIKINEPGKVKMKFKQFNLKIFIKFFDENILKEEI